MQILLEDMDLSKEIVRSETYERSRSILTLQRAFMLILRVFKAGQAYYE